MNCKICGSTHNISILVAKEMMFGTLEEFHYLECGNCGCLQLENIPRDMSKYYPANYYSFTENLQNDRYISIKRNLIITRDKYLIGIKSPIGFFLNRWFKSTYSLSLKFSYQVLLRNRSSKLLDLGCGSGDFIFYLRKLGFDNVFGADPFINKDIFLNNGQFIFKKNIFDLPVAGFNGIMLNHSFEHMSEPLKVLLAIKDKLAEDGTCMIRVPVTDSTAFSTYRENWYQLDAPRHLFLYTNKSMELLANNAGFKIVSIENDSNIKQFVSSILYQKGIPLLKQKFEEQFSSVELTNFQELTKVMNNKGLGDQRAYFLKKAK